MGKVFGNGPAGLVVAGLVVAGVLAGGTGMSGAMEKPPQGVVKVACVAEGAKTRLPRGLCQLFQKRLAAAYPGVLFTQGEVPGRLTLVVSQGGSHLITARLLRDDGTEGAPSSAARRDAPLDVTAYGRFLDGLIAAGPKP